MNPTGNPTRQATSPIFFSAKAGIISRILKFFNILSSSKTQDNPIMQRVPGICETFQSNSGKVPLKIKIELATSIISSVISCVTIGKILSILLTAASFAGITGIVVIIAIASLVIAIVAIHLLLHDIGKACRSARELSREAENLQNKIEDFNAVYKRQEENINALNGVLNEANEALRAQKEELLKQEESISSLEGINKELSNTMDEQKLRFKFLCSSTEEVFKQVEISIKKNEETLRLDIEKAEMQIDALKNTNGVFNQTVENIKESFKEKTNCIKSLIDKQRNLLAQAVKNTKELDEAEKCKNLMNIITDAFGLNVEITDQINNLFADFNPILDGLRNLLGQDLNNLENKISEAKTQSEEKSKELENLKKGLDIETRACKNGLLRANAQNAIMSKNIQETSEEIETLKTQLRMLEKKREDLELSLAQSSSLAMAIQNTRLNMEIKTNEISEQARELQESMRAMKDDTVDNLGTGEKKGQGLKGIVGDVFTFAGSILGLCSGSPFAIVKSICNIIPLICRYTTSQA